MPSSPCDAAECGQSGISKSTSGWNTSPSEKSPSAQRSYTRRTSSTFSCDIAAQVSLVAECGPMQARRSIPLAVGALAAAAIALGGVLIGTLVHDDGGASKAQHPTGSATAPARAKKATPGQPGVAPVSVQAQQVRGTFASATRRRQRAS